MPLTVLNVAYPLAEVSPRTAGGAEQVLLTLDQGLVEHGHRSLVLAAAGSRCAGLLIPVRIPSGELNETAKRQARESFRRALKHALDTHSVDVVHMHGLDFDQYLPDMEIPVVVTLHLPLAWYRQSALRMQRPGFSLIAVSKSQAQPAPAGVKIDAVIPNGIELSHFAPAKRHGNYALVMGRICPEKGIHIALDAAERANVPVVLAGQVFDYPEHKSYFEKAIAPRLGRMVQFVGPVGGGRKAFLLAGAKCLLIASQAPETSSLVAMEAMAASTPVIAWRSGALGEIVTDGRTGYLVSSVNEMSEKVMMVDKISRSQCRQEAEQYFSSERMLQAYIDLYSQRAKALELSQKLQAA